MSAYLVSVLRRNSNYMKKSVITTPNAPSAIGTYSQAIEANGLIFTSGQISIDPQTGDMVKSGCKGQTDQILENINAILSASGVDRSHILKLTVFITDLNGFPQVNDSFKEFFGDIEFPARSTVEVSALPMGALVEIECIASL